MKGAASASEPPASLRAEHPSHWGALISWSLLAGASLFLSLKNIDERAEQIGLSQGRNIFLLTDAMLIRNFEHARIRAQHRDSLNLPKAAIVDGRPYPTDATRQVFGLIEHESGMRIRLVGLTPLDPKNVANAWEAEALQTIGSNAHDEVIALDAGISRYIAPLYMRPECTGCHRGLRPGDLYGAISIAWPSPPAGGEIRRSIATHAATWLLLSILMIIAMRRFALDGAKLEKSQSALGAVNANLNAAANTRARELLASTQQLRAISSNAPGIVYQYLLRPDGSSAIPYANEQFYQVFGLHPEEVSGNAARMLERLHPDDLAEFIASTRYSARDMTPWQHEFRILDEQGHERWLYGDTVPQRGDNGLVLWNGFITDITQRKLADAELRRHKAIIDTAQDGFWMVDEQGRLQEVNQAYAGMTGYKIEELLRMHVSDLDTNEASDEIKAHIDTLFTVGHDVFETRHRHKDGHMIDIEMSATFMRELKTFFVFCRDITARRQYQQRLQESENRYRLLADYDALTTLPNRRLLADRLNAALATGQRSGSFGALMLLDLDNFKPLNDLHGHDMGDLLLIEASARLKKCVREVDTVARIGGDEFVVVLTELNRDRAKSKEQAMQVAQKIRACLSEPYLLNDRGTVVEHHCSASIGVALFSGHRSTQADIFKRADTAMYISKDSGRNKVCFDESSDPKG